MGMDRRLRQARGLPAPMPIPGPWQVPLMGSGMDVTRSWIQVRQGKRLLGMAG